MGRSALMAVSLSLCAAAPGQAQSARVQAGVHGNVSDDADLGLGADVRWSFLRSDPRLALVGSFDYFFPDDDTVEFIAGEDALRRLLDSFLGGNGPDELGGNFHLPDISFETQQKYWEVNLDLTYDFGASGKVVPYAGVGVNYAHASVEFLDIEERNSDVGANVLAGVRIARRVFVQAKKEAGGGDLFVLTAGVRF